MAEDRKGRIYVATSCSCYCGRFSSFHCDHFCQHSRAQAWRNSFTDYYNVFFRWVFLRTLIWSEAICSKRLAGRGGTGFSRPNREAKNKQPGKELSNGTSRHCLRSAFDSVLRDRYLPRIGHPQLNHWQRVADYSVCHRDFHAH